VLIVDDQPCFRDAAWALVQARGHHVVAVAEDGSSALAALALAPDAVLLDVSLQQESGFDVAWALTRARPGLAVLLMSADATGVRPEDVRECGARGFVLKRQLAAADLDGLWRGA
jgi:DNA-binding NarL/FixJ family response regulator